MSTTIFLHEVFLSFFREVKEVLLSFSSFFPPSLLSSVLFSSDVRTSDVLVSFSSISISFGRSLWKSKSRPLSRMNLYNETKIMTKSFVEVFASELKRN